MSKIPLWLDCDTGTDDAVAIMTAHALDELEIVGISAMCGNTSQQNAFYNTHRICGLIGANYPVYPGAESPLITKLNYGVAFHGENGLGDVELPVPEDAVINSEKGWDALYRTAMEYEGQLRLVATGPLTNLAIAFSKYPRLPQMLHSVLIMGGAASFGNVTPAAEFNIHADPHAAQMVFKSGIKIYMFGLDVTLQEYFTDDDLNELEATGTKCGKFTHDCLQGAMKSLKKIGLPGVSIHDACPVVYLVYPDMFKMEEAGVFIETQGKYTMGKTVTDLYSDRQFEEKNAYVGTYVDKDRYIELLKNCIIQNG